MVNINEVPYIQGACSEMCPAAEINERVRYNNLHVLERNLADPEDTSLMIKKYYRQLPTHEGSGEAQYLRNRQGIAKTMDRISRLMNMENVLFVERASFICDRYRAVWKDMNIQYWTDLFRVTCLEEIVRFCIYAEYRLVMEEGTVNNTINFQDIYNFEEGMDIIRQSLVKLDQIYDKLREMGNPAPNEAEFRYYHILLKLIPVKSIYNKRQIIESYFRQFLQIDELYEKLKVCWDLYKAYENNFYEKILKFTRSLNFFQFGVAGRFIRYVRKLAVDQYIKEQKTVENAKILLSIEDFSEKFTIDRESSIKFADYYSLPLVSQGSNIFVDLSVEMHVRDPEMPCPKWGYKHVEYETQKNIYTVSEIVKQISSKNFFCKDNSFSCAPIGFPGYIHIENCTRAIMAMRRISEHEAYTEYNKFLKKFPCLQKISKRPKEAGGICQNVEREIESPEPTLAVAETNALSSSDTVIPNEESTNEKEAANKYTEENEDASSSNKTLELVQKNSVGSIYAPLPCRQEMLIIPLPSALSVLFHYNTGNFKISRPSLGDKFRFPFSGLNLDSLREVVLPSFKLDNHDSILLNFEEAEAVAQRECGYVEGGEMDWLRLPELVKTNVTSTDSDKQQVSRCCLVAKPQLLAIQEKEIDLRKGEAPNFEREWDEEYFESDEDLEQHQENKDFPKSFIKASFERDYKKFIKILQFGLEGNAETSVNNAYLKYKELFKERCQMLYECVKACPSGWRCDQTEISKLLSPLEEWKVPNLSPVEFPVKISEAQLKQEIFNYCNSHLLKIPKSLIFTATKGKLKYNLNVLINIGCFFKLLFFTSHKNFNDTNADRICFAEIWFHSKFSSHTHIPSTSSKKEEQLAIASSEPVSGDNISECLRQTAIVGASLEKTEVDVEILNYPLAVKFTEVDLRNANNFIIAFFLVTNSSEADLVKTKIEEFLNFWNRTKGKSSGGSFVIFSDSDINSNFIKILPSRNFQISVKIIDIRNFLRMEREKLEREFRNRWHRECGRGDLVVIGSREEAKIVEEPFSVAFKFVEKEIRENKNTAFCKKLK